MMVAETEENRDFIEPRAATNEAAAGEHVHSHGADEDHDCPVCNASKPKKPKIGAV